MSSPVNNLSVTIKTEAGIQVGSPILTDSLGAISILLPPGIYQAVVSPLFGYTFDGGILVLPDNTNIPITDLTITGIVIVSDGTTNISAGFVQNVV